MTAGQNETRKYVKKAANTWGVEGGVSANVDPSNLAKLDAFNTFSKSQKTVFATPQALDFTLEFFKKMFYQLLWSKIIYKQTESFQHNYY